MNTIQFVMAIVNWLAADPAHVALAASAAAALTPTPNPTTWAGKVYRVVDFFALNFLHAKDTGIQPADVQKIAQEVSAMLAKAQAPTPVVNPVIPHQ